MKSSSVFFFFFSAALLAAFSIIAALNQFLFLGPPSIPGSHGLLHSAEIIKLAGAVGPESLAFDPDGGGPYVGVADGRILKWQGHELGWVDFAVTSSQRRDCIRPLALEMEHVCGRPLGLRFEKKTGNLYIADAYLGLQIVGPAGGVATPLVTEAEELPLRFTNDLDIDEVEDVIYFTDTSTSFQRRQFMTSILSGDKTGRLLKYNKSSRELIVLLRGLAFANGVALSKDRSSVLVAESSSCRIIRVWLHGPNAGDSEVFAEVPGFPDNVRRNSEGEFWVALHAKKGLMAELISRNPWIGKALLKLPFNFKQLHAMLFGWKPHAVAVKLGETGEVLEVLEDSEGRSLKFISEVEERDGRLWIGSVLMPFLGVYDLH